MKKSAIILLLIITVAFAAFVGGFYVGKNYNRTSIEVTATQASQPTSTASTGSIPTTQTTQAKLININTATLEELMSLKNIGATKAQAIIDYRTEYGPFESVEDLLNVSGIGEKILQSIRDNITVGG